MTTALRLFKKVSHTTLRMDKNLNALQYIMNINNGRQNIASFIFSNEANNKIHRPGDAWIREHQILEFL